MTTPMEDAEAQRVLDSINSITIDPAKWIAVWMMSRRRVLPPSAGPAPSPQDQPLPTPPIAPAAGQATHQTQKAEPLATQAMRDLIALVALAEHVPEAADALQECFKLGIPVLGCDIDADATKIAGKFVPYFYLNERLARFLPAPLTRKRENGLQ